MGFIVPAMVTRIRKSVKARVYLREWRKKLGIDAVTLAGRLEIERESYYRLEREPLKLSAGELMKLEEAMNLAPGQLWRMPGTPEIPSLDEIVQNAPPDIRDMAADVVRRMVAKGGS